MQTEVKIRKGLTDWQIVQQKNGVASITVSGSLKSADKDSGVFVRIVREDTGETVLPWQLSRNYGSGRWKALLKDVPAGGLYRLETCLDQKNSFTHRWGLRGDMIHFFGVGDLYVIAGQSNSAGYGKDPAYDPPELGVHLFANSGLWKLAAHPMNDSTDTVHEINCETANPGNSPYLSFAKYLKRELHYPIGLIQTSLGGSPLSRWNPEEDGDLYRNMLRVVDAVGGSVTGILWYQGCADTDVKSAATYLERFLQMTEHAGRDFAGGRPPFLTVQLGRCTANPEDMTDQGFSMVREAQRLAARKLENVYVTPALDLALTDCIHISSAAAVLLGERLAKLALEHIYGKNAKGTAPDILEAVQTAKNRILLRFSNVSEYLYSYEVPPEKLSLRPEDENGPIPIRRYSIEGADRYILELGRDVKGQVCLHNAAGMNPEGVCPVDYATQLPLMAFYGVPVTCLSVSSDHTEAENPPA